MHPLGLLEEKRHPPATLDLGTDVPGAGFFFSWSVNGENIVNVGSTWGPGAMFSACNLFSSDPQ